MGTEQKRYLGGGLGAVAPQRKRKKKTKKEKKKKEKKEKKRKRKKGTMNDVELLHKKVLFFQFFNSPVALKNLKKFRGIQGWTGHLRQISENRHSTI